MLTTEAQRAQSAQRMNYCWSSLCPLCLDGEIFLVYFDALLGALSGNYFSFVLLSYFIENGLQPPSQLGIGLLLLSG
jgi:hypothetical protein